MGWVPSRLNKYIEERERKREREREREREIVITIVSDLRQVGGFLQFPLPKKLIVTI